MSKVLQPTRTLDRIISTIGDLPATPAVIAMLMNLTSHIDTDIDKISRVILADQSLTAKVLKLSNSSFYGRAKEVKTLREAVVILGFLTLHSLVIATATQRLYQKTVDDGISDKLWEHASAAAIGSRLTAQAARFPYVEEAFIAGLLHDIGKLVLTQKMTEDYRRVVRGIEAARGSFVEHEEAAFGFNHAQVGALLLQKWSFPRELAEAIGAHHQPPDSEGLYTALPHIINLGNFLAKTLDVGFNDFAVDDLASLPSAVRLKLDAARLEEIQVQLAGHFEDEREFFKLRN